MHQANYFCVCLQSILTGERLFWGILAAEPAAKMAQNNPCIKLIAKDAYANRKCPLILKTSTGEWVLDRSSNLSQPDNFDAMRNVVTSPFAEHHPQRAQMAFK